MAARPAPLAGHRPALAGAAAIATVVLADAAAVWVADRRCEGLTTPGSRLERFCDRSGTLFHAWPFGLAIAIVAVVVGTTYAVRTRSLVPLAVAAAPTIAALLLAWTPAVVAGKP
jgi:hypothetical protein